MTRSLRYVFDTDICIYLLNGHTQLKARVAEVGIDAISVAMPTVAELYFGAYNSEHVAENLVRVRAFFSEPGPEILPIDDHAAEHFGRFKADLRRRGQIIGDIDLLIAGVAVSRKLVIVTNNIQHFERISGLSLENWVEPTL